MLKVDSRIKFLQNFWDARIADKKAVEVPEEDLIEFFVDEVSK
jgi:hypothetical protein